MDFIYVFILICVLPIWARYCSKKIANGELSEYCQEKIYIKVGQFCFYDCDPGYERNTSFSSYLTCVSPGTWSDDPNALCVRTPTTTFKPLPITCSSTIPRGRISNSCDRLPSSSCSYACDAYCHPTLTFLSCNDEGSWDLAHEACTCTDSEDPDLCPPTLPHGKISPGCNRSPYATCTFICDRNCFATRHEVQCNLFKTWDFAYSACKCTEPDTKPTSGPQNFNETSSNVDNDKIDYTILIATLVGVLVPTFIIIAIGLCIMQRKSSRATLRQTDTIPTPGGTNTFHEEQFTPLQPQTEPFPYPHAQTQPTMPTAPTLDVIDSQQYLPESTGAIDESQPYTPESTGTKDISELPPSYDEVRTDPEAYSYTK